MKILHVNQQIGPGGASGICLTLHNALLAGGQESAALVGRRAACFSGVEILDNDRYRSGWGRFWMSAAGRLHPYSGRIRGAQRVSERWLPRLASPRRFWSWWIGREDFEFPGTRHLLEQAPFTPEVLHLHNLHGGYFDLRELPRLSGEVPTLVTLHDAWLLAGHCSHSFDCDRWITGCGSCPHMDIMPAIRRDESAYNWQRKRDIYRESRLSLVCPSQWLADKVRQSVLMAAADRLRVIPNGVDTSVFYPRDKSAARERLGWPREEFIVIFAANGVRQSMWKDYAAMRRAVQLAGEKADGRPMRFFAIGDSHLAEEAGMVKIEFLPYRESMSECYQAADVYIHATKADTFPTTILESLACGTPVVATAVGGIPEQIIEGKTGFLVAPGDAQAMAGHLTSLAQSPELVRSMGAAARLDAAHRFSLKKMVVEYVKLYHEMIEQRNATREN